MMGSRHLHIATEVAQALKNGEPVVALESTIISHGMPYPENVESAQMSEQVIRERGATPATVAVLGGVLTVGMTEEQLHHLGRDSAIPKASRRDLAALLAHGRDGATTVATTMMGADAAGIRFFATGGIGGVHRGAQQSFDISADLAELSRTPVCVVCAGAKLILDIGLTLEVLETLGVPILGYKTDDFPAFYTRSSGFVVDYRVDNPQQVVGILRIHWEQLVGGGVVVANPIPEAYEMDRREMEEDITRALASCAAQGVTGKHVTPFLLSELHRDTGGESLHANKQLVYHNCAVAADIAIVYCNSR